MKNETIGSVAAHALRDNELDCVNGGIIDGCIPRPKILEQWLPPQSGYVDQFASRLPSWVRPL